MTYANRSVAVLGLTILTLAVGRAAASGSSPQASQAAPVHAGCVAPGFAAMFDVTGEHGMEHESELRNIAGKAIAVAFKDGDGVELVTFFKPDAAEKVLIGCPFSFFHITRAGELRAESEFRTAYACRLLNNVLVPRNIEKTGESVADLLLEVPVLDTSIAANLKVQTVPDRKGAGWVRTESLARNSDAKMLPPGRSVLVDWAAKSDVDGQNLLSLGEVRYKLRVADQGNEIILVSTRVTRAQISELTSQQLVAVQADVAVLKSVARDWVNDRARAMKSLNILIEKSKNSVFTDYYPWVKQQLEKDIKNMGERDKWRDPRPDRHPPGGVPASRPAPVPIPTH